MHLQKKQSKITKKIISKFCKIIKKYTQIENLQKLRFLKFDHKHLIKKHQDLNVET